jgi:group I intron endonuclease
MIGIYKITSPTNRIYIGQSRNIKKRFSNYKNLDCKEQRKLYNSFKKYGVDNHNFEVIEECLINDLNKKERYYQDLFSVTTDLGLNCILTSCLDAARVYSAETIIKMSNSRMGIKLSDETKMKLSKINKGNSYAKGYKHTPEALIKISESSKGRKTHINAIIACKLKISKKVIDIKTGVIYTSITECAKMNNLSAMTLGRYLNNKRKNKTNFLFHD